MKSKTLFFVSLLVAFLLGTPAVSAQDTITVKGVVFATNTKAKEAFVVAKEGGYSGSVNIPATITIDYEPYNVTIIKSGAFKDCANLKDVVIPSSMMILEKGAFANVPAGLQIYINKTNRFFRANDAFDQSCYENATLNLPTEGILKEWVKYGPYFNFKKTGIVPKAKSDGADRRTRAEKMADDKRFKTSKRSKRIAY